MGLTGYCLGLMIFYKMSSRTHHNICNKITALSVLGIMSMFLSLFSSTKAASQTLDADGTLERRSGCHGVLCFWRFLDYEQSLFFLSPSCETRETRKWPRAWREGARRERHEKRETTSAVISSVSWLRRSTLARAWTPLTESGENERLLAV